MVSASGVIGSRHDIDLRNQDIFSFHLQGVSRKEIAALMQMEYEAVKKVIQKMLRRGSYRKR